MKAVDVISKYLSSLLKFENKYTMLALNMLTSNLNIPKRSKDERAFKAHKYLGNI